MSQAYRVPSGLEQSAKALGVESQAIELHKRLTVP